MHQAFTHNDLQRDLDDRLHVLRHHHPLLLGRITGWWNDASAAHVRDPVLRLLGVLGNLGLEPVVCLIDGAVDLPEKPRLPFVDDLLCYSQQLLLVRRVFQDLGPVVRQEARQAIGGENAADGVAELFKPSRCVDHDPASIHPPAYHPSRLRQNARPVGLHVPDDFILSRPIAVRGWVAFVVQPAVDAPRQEIVTG